MQKQYLQDQDLQASCHKFVNVTSPNNLTKSGFPDIADVDDETVWKKGTVLVTGNSITPSLRESEISERMLIKVCCFTEVRICDVFFYSATQIVEKTGKLKQYILELLPTVKLVISTQTLRTDKANVNSISAEVTELLGTKDEKIKHLGKYGLHTDNIGT